MTKISRVINIFFRDKLEKIFEHRYFGGRMGVDEKLIEEIIRRILSVAKAERIILFGSAAIGGMNRDSDIDLLVLESDPDNIIKESVRIREALRGMGYPFDIIVMATERFEESKGVIGGIAFPANKYGKVIYEAA